MLVERLRESENGAVHPASWRQIQQLENQAHEVFLDFVRESGGVTGQGYSARIVPGTSLEADLQPYVGDASHEFYVIEQNTDYSSDTSAFDMTAMTGIRRQRFTDTSDKPDYWELTDSWWGRAGYRLLGELFEPGKYPELSELALEKRSQLVDPEELPARIMTHEEYKRAVATARLSQFAMAHLDHILKLYHRIAYAGARFEPRPESPSEELLKYLHAGKSVGLRPGTKYLGCAKHQLDTKAREDTLKSWMYLNYDIPIGPVNLHFREDIAMAVELGEATTAHFAEQGISA